VATEPTWDDLFPLDRKTGTPEAEQQVAPEAAAQPYEPTAAELLFGSAPAAPSAEPVNPPPAAAYPLASDSADEPLTRRQVRENEGHTRVDHDATAGSGRGSRRGASRPPGRPKRRRRLGWLWALLSVLVVGAVTAGLVWTNYEPQVRKVMGWELPTDYTGTGNGQKVAITILSGQIGSDVATTLQKQGVTMTFTAFYKLLLAQSPAPTFEPGTYTLQKHMSAKSALAQLTDPKNRVVSKVVIPEGTTLPKTLSRLAAGTGVPLAEFTKASKNFVALGVPSNAPSIEGYLFPATYDFDPGLSAKAILQRMVDRTYVSLKKAGVTKAQSLKVLTLASIIQKEGGSVKDFYKVSRVFHNRLDANMLLQSDATVSYGSGGTTISTTDAERADASNKYNTYVHLGLPIGPIAAAGDAAIDAAQHPVAGPWFYFVLVNGSTGETKFSTTLAQHNAAVLQWQAWLRAHPGFGG
jgi:UPF0755 protein